MTRNTRFQHVTIKDLTSRDLDSGLTSVKTSTTGLDTLHTGEMKTMTQHSIFTSNVRQEMFIRQFLSLSIVMRQTITYMPTHVKFTLTLMYTTLKLRNMITKKVKISLREKTNMRFGKL
jgi:hypothetical protein